MEDQFMFMGKIYTPSVLEDYTGPELVDLYNRVVENTSDRPPVSKFSDRQTGINRVLGVLKDVQGTASAEESRSISARKKNFNLPATGEIKTCRPGSLRDQVRQRALDGVTFEEVVDIVRQFDQSRGILSKNAERRAYEVVRILHYNLGYGLRQDADGRIYARIE